MARRTIAALKRCATQSQAPPKVKCHAEFLRGLLNHDFLRRLLGNLGEFYLFHSTHGVMLIGNGETGVREGIADQPIRIEIHLPIVCVVAVRAHS